MGLLCEQFTGDRLRVVAHLQLMLGPRLEASLDVGAVGDGIAPGVHGDTAGGRPLDSVPVVVGGDEAILDGVADDIAPDRGEEPLDEDGLAVLELAVSLGDDEANGRATDLGRVVGELVGQEARERVTDEMVDEARERLVRAGRLKGLQLLARGKGQDFAADEGRGFVRVGQPVVAVVLRTHPEGFKVRLRAVELRVLTGDRAGDVRGGLDRQLLQRQDFHHVDDVVDAVLKGAVSARARG